MAPLSTPTTPGLLNAPVGTLPGLATLLAQWDALPYRWLSAVTPQRRAAYALAQIASAQERGAPTFVSTATGGACTGLIQLEPLPWDSGLMGRRVARIPWWVVMPEREAADLGQLLEAVLQEARALRFDYLWVRVPSSHPRQVQALESRGFQTVDTLLTFATPLPARDDNRVNPALECRPVRPEEFSQVESLAAACFTQDRFHSDPSIPKAVADEVYRQWAGNCCRGQADVVFVASLDGRLVGFVALRCDRLAGSVLGLRAGQIVLVATGPNARRMGVAATLTQAALRWFSEQGCVYAEVGTQLANLRAARLYQSAGFRLAQASMTLRLLL
jgi:GNAT superfamily N-acetyltransferase